MTANFSEFEVAIIRAREIYKSMPAEVRLRINRSMHPAHYGDDVRSALFGIVDEELSFLKAIRATYGHKLCQYLGRLQSPTFQDSGSFMPSIV